MEIYLSFSTKLNKSISPTYKRDTINLFNLCVSLLNNFNYDVNIITDSEGYDWLKHLKVNSLTKELDSINFLYNDVWSISKLHVFNIISKRKKPFIHIDHDFFILKEFDKQILDAEVIVQSKEFNLNRLNYHLDVFNHFCRNKYYAENSNINYAYNCGIIGGKNYEFFQEYSDSAIKMVNNPANSSFWSLCQKDYNFSHTTKATLAEQYYLACCLDKFKINPFLFFDNTKIQMNYNIGHSFYLYETKAIHLFGHKKEIDAVKDYIVKLSHKIK